MDVNSVNNTFVTATTQGLQRAPDAGESGKTGPHRDGDADDGGSIKAATSPAVPNVNLNGQKIGQVVNVKT
ncbi:MAG: hypothetical protein IH605_16505 [Burkholderiales bacterium]|nr:hypothetical protein [Burkholderiales bacterium]